MEKLNLPLRGTKKDKQLEYCRGCLKYYTDKAAPLFDRLFKAESMGASQESNRWYPKYKELLAKFEDLLNSIEAEEKKIRTLEKHENKK